MLRDKKLTLSIKCITDQGKEPNNICTELGVPIYYAHDAFIEHIVTADRLTRRYIWRRTYWSGVTHAIAGALLGGRSEPET
jgi:hypothetical protein